MFMLRGGVRLDVNEELKLLWKLKKTTFFLGGVGSVGGGSGGWVAGGGGGGGVGGGQGGVRVDVTEK